MTVVSAARRSSIYTPNGVTQDWSFEFFWYDSSTLRLFVRDAAGNDTIISPSLYTLTPGEGNLSDGYIGGTITYPIAPIAPLSEGKVYITRELQPTQETLDLTLTSGFDPRIVERAIDEVVMLVQQAIDGVITAGVVRSLPPESSYFLPAPETNKIVGWNAGATELENKTPASAFTVTEDGYIAQSSGGTGFPTLAAAIAALASPIAQSVGGTGASSLGAGLVTPTGGVEDTLSDHLGILYDRHSFFGPPSGSDDGAALNAAIAALAAAGGGTLYIRPGLYRSSVRLSVTPGVHVIGLGELTGWVEGVTPDTSIGVTIVFTGTGARDLTLDWCGDLSQCGMTRTNPQVDYGGTLDGVFRPLDMTNRNASGATRATLRAFSAAVLLGSAANSHRARLSNVRILPACAVGADLLAGYGSASVVGWDEWDFGVYAPCAWHNVVEDCQIVGYWHERAVLQTSIANGNAQTGQRGEQVNWERCRFQGGVCVRNGDMWPVAGKTADTISTTWTASHRFPSNGTLLTDVGSITYTGLSFSSPNLTFTGCSSTAAVVTSGDNRTMIFTTNNNGTSQTSFRDCEFLDFHHALRLERPNSAFGAQARRHAPAVELSGFPVRAVRFYDSHIYAHGPLAWHIAGGRNIEVFGQTCEAKSYRLTVGGADQAASALMIIGPAAASLAAIPSSYYGDYSGWGFGLQSRVNRAPMVSPSSGGRFASYADAANPQSYIEDAVGSDIQIRYNRALPREATIAGGVLTVVDRFTLVDTEGGAATDDVTEIKAPEWLNEIIIQQANSGRDPTFVHDTSKISLGGANVTLFGLGDTLHLVRRSGVWYRAGSV